MNEKLAKIRPYYKYELTELYKISIKTFMKRIRPILKELYKTGYKTNQKIFTLKQTEIIFSNMRHPNANEKSGVHSEKKAPIYSYSKSQLEDFYNISGKTLLAQIESIPFEEIKKVIMDANNTYNAWERRIDKQKFRRKEVKLIFEYLGHPDAVEGFPE